MKRLITTGAVLLVSAMLCSTAFPSDKSGGKGRPGRDGMMGLHGDIERMTSPGMNKACRTPEFYLNKAGLIELTTEQLDRMEALYYDLKRTMIEKGARVKVLELELTELVGRPDFDLGDAKSVMKKVEDARTDLRGSVLESAAAARDILTPEQLDMVRAMRRSPVTERPYNKRGMKMQDDDYRLEDDAIRRKMKQKMKERMGAPGGMEDMYDD